MNEGASNPSSSSEAIELLSSVLTSPDSLSKISGIIEKHTSREIRDDPPQNSNYNQVSDESQINSSDNPADKEAISPTLQSNSSLADEENPLGIFSFLSSKKLDSFTLKSEQTALLLAIRPYLSEHRKELIDSFINLNKIAKIFTNLS